MTARGSLPASNSLGERGIGLFGMAERLALIGGVLDIRSAPGQGTTIVAEIRSMDEADEITVVLADDHAVPPCGLRSLLDAEPDIAVVGEAGDGEAAIELVRSLRPTVVVMDLSMPARAGWPRSRRSSRMCRIPTCCADDARRRTVPVPRVEPAARATSSRAAPTRICSRRSAQWRTAASRLRAAAAHILKGYVEVSGMPDPFEEGRA